MKTMTKQMRQTSIIGIVLFCAGLMGNLFAADDYTTWPHSLNLVLNTTSTGASVTSTVTNFPVLVRLNSSNFANFSQTLTGGTDIRFSKANGAHLRYQIERWDVTNQVAEVWVLVDTVFGNNRAQKIKMYWGNGSTADSSNGAAVFDTANGFVSVYHMNALSGNITDATVNSFSGTATGSPTYQQAGTVGKAIALSGDSQYFDAGNSTKFIMSSNKVTVSAWVNRAGAASGAPEEGIVGKYKWGGGVNYREYSLINHASNGFTFFVSSDGTSTNETGLAANVVPVNGTWNYVTGMMDASNMYIFVNGVQKNTVAKTTIFGSTNATLKVGLMDDYLTYHQNWNGTLDEVRVEKVARSADWIKLCYQNQMSSQNLVEIEDYSQWGNHKSILLNTTVTGSNVTTNQYKFPVLLRFTSNNFLVGAMQNGEDLRFAKTNGDILSYEIERWDATNQVAEVWVKLDTVFGSNNTQSFTMYWGKTGSVSKSNSTAVFDTGNGFAGVWHLGEAGNTTAGGYADATYNANNGTGTSTTSSQATGDVGKAQTFDGSTNYITVANATSLNPVYMTVSAWANPSTWATDLESIVSKQTSATPWPPIDFRKTTGASTIEAAVTVSGTSHVVVGGAVSTGSWQYLTFTYDGTNILVYNNGVQTGSGAYSGTITSGTSVLTFAKNSSVAARMFNGLVDEVEMSKTARSADWIKLCYESQKIGATLVIPDPPSGLTYTANTAAYIVNTAITPNNPSSTGGSISSYSISPALPTGLSFNTTTGVISGTPTAVAAQASYTVTATNVSGSTTATLTIAVAAQCIAPSKGLITGNPSRFPSVTGATPVGSTVSFTVTIDASVSAPVSYQWYRRSAGTTVWSQITSGTGYNAATYSFAADSASDSAHFYCHISNSCNATGVNTDSLAYCRICVRPKVTAQTPASGAIISANAGTLVSMSVTASGVDTVQWQYKASAGAWASVSSGTGGQLSSYSFTCAQTDNGNLYRCQIINGCNDATPVYSDSVSLAVCTQPAIGNPPQNASVVAGSSATFTVTASGSGTLSYQWQDSTSLHTWTNINSVTYPTAITPTFTFTAASSDDQKRVHCIVTGCGNPVTSAAAILSVCTTPSFTTQPTSQSVIAGATDTIKVAVGGTGPFTYLWQYSSNGTTWTDSVGATNTSVNFIVTSAMNSRIYRCKVTNGSSCGSALNYSNLCTLTVCTPPSISPTGQPVNPPSSTKVGDSVSFGVTVNAGATSPTYQWWRSAISPVSWAKAAGTNATNAIYGLKVTAADTGVQYRCEITNGCGDIYSNIVSISGCTPPSTTNPRDTLYTLGDTAKFSVTASGTGPFTYQWQDSSAAHTWTAISYATGSTSPLLSFVTNATLDGYKYHCIVSGLCGSATSNGAKLTVCTQPYSISAGSTQTHQAGEKAVFTGTVPGSVSSPVYLWQRDSSGNNVWATVSGISNAPTCTVTVVATDNASRFRCKVTNSCGTQTSNLCTLWVCSPVAITTQPVNKSVVNGVPDSIVVAAAGSGTLTYKWQMSFDTAKSWADISGATYPVYKFTPSLTSYVPSYKCVISNGCGNPIASNVVTVTVCDPPKITTDPVAPLNINPGNKATFSVAATGTSLIYQWQRSNDTAKTWKNCDTTNGAVGANSNSYTFTTDTSMANKDNNAQFRCVVTSCGSATSKAAILTVCAKPQIVVQPTFPATPYTVGAAAVCSTICTGTNPTYLWQRSPDGVAWSIVDTTNGKGRLPKYSFITSKTDNGAQFKCTVTGNCGSVVTAVATISVCTPVSIDSQFVPKNFLVGDSVNFRVVVSGSVPKIYWQKKAKTDTAFAAIDSLKSKITFVAKSADSGSLYRAMVLGQCSSALYSSTDTLQVYVPLKAMFSATPIIGQAPLSVQFSDSSLGSFTSRIWNFGDGTAPDSVSSAPKHIYTDATQSHTYTVKLLINGPSPRKADSMSVQISTYPAGANPVSIKGAYVSPTSMLVTFSNFGSIKDVTHISNPDSVNGDTIGIWYKKSAIPTTPDSATLINKKYTIGQLKTQGTSVFSDTITGFPVLSGSDTAYGIMNAITWYSGKKSTFSSVNADYVLMKDTAVVQNNLTISCRNLLPDTAAIDIDNVAKLAANVDSVDIWYSITSGTPDYTSATVIRLSRDSIMAIAAKDTAGKYHWYKKDPTFDMQQVTFYAAVRLVGKNGKPSLNNTASILVGNKRPVNPLKLTAKALSSSSIQLTWNIGTGFDKIMIWYKSDTPVDTADAHGYNFASLHLDSIVPTLGTVSYIGNIFNPSTKYYFYAQVLKNPLWSDVTDSSTDSCTTWTAGALLDTNSIVITKHVFDTLTNNINIAWTVDTTQADSLQVGISYSLNGYSDLINTSTGNGYADLKNTFKGQQIVPVTSHAGSANLTFLPSDALTFDTTYYIALWLRRVDGSWTYLPNSGQAATTVHVPNFTWESIAYFKPVTDINGAKPTDTAYAFNKNIRIINQPGMNYSTINTVYYCPPDSSTLANFIVMSTPFKFSHLDSAMKIYIGLQIIDTFPTGYFPKDVRIYRKDTTTGTWSIATEPVTIERAVNGYISILTDNLSGIFAAMIDTVSPKLKILSDISLPVKPDSSFSDTVSISDNISNVSWWIQSSKGGDQLHADSSGVLKACSETLKLVVHSSDVSPDNGVRSIIIYSDGVHTDTTDLSRIVKKDSCGILNIDAQKWAALTTPMNLDITGAKVLLKNMMAPDTVNWKYDIKKVRLFRWYSSAANSSNPSKWVEFADTSSDLFNFTRGSLFWIKTKVKSSIQLGSGYTPSLGSPYTMTVAPQSWVDFSLPYKFDIKIGDILQATKAFDSTQNTDSLNFYSWLSDAALKYTSDLIYSIANPDKNIADTALSSSGQTGYTIYNPSLKPVVVKIPPVPKSISQYSAAKKLAKDKTSWVIKISTKLADSSTLSPVYCGYTKSAAGGTSYYPVAPSFANVSAGVFNPLAKTVHGQSFTHAAVDGGYAFVLAFTNSTSQKEAVRYTLENAVPVPQGSEVAVFNANTQQFETLKNGSGYITVDVNNTEYRWLLVGSKDYLAKASIIAPTMKLLFTGTYPNPFRSQVRIRYSLPYTGVDKVHFAIYDLLGRSIWQHEISSASQYGKNEIIWNAKTNEGRSIAAGLYIIRMTAINEKQKAVGIFDRKMTYMP